MKIKSITVYPIKGIAGVSVNTASVFKSGLEHDRKYMLVDENYQMISQRTVPALCQMKPTRAEMAWHISYLGEQVLVEDDCMSNTILRVEIWETFVDSREVSEYISQWFSKQLGVKCFLVKMSNPTARIKDVIKPPFSTVLSFADGYPVQVLGDKSIDLLNAKLDTPIDENRFRSNIYVETSKPHEEDLWGDFQIGNQVTLRSIKPCVRCAVIMIDQKTGEMGREPTNTLSKYRKFGKNICFGSNVVVLQEGVISVGDKISLL